MGSSERPGSLYSGDDLKSVGSINGRGELMGPEVLIDELS